MIKLVSTKTKNRLEELIIKSFRETGDVNVVTDELQQELEKQNISHEKYRDMIPGHFFLAANNVTRAQLLLGFLAVVVSLALTAVRIGNDFGLLVIMGVIGAVIGLPYFLFFIFCKQTSDLQYIDFIAKVSFIYSFFVGIFFIIFCLYLQLTGLALVPVLILVLFFLELRKLQKLIKTNKNTSE